MSELMSHSRGKTIGQCGHKYYLKYRAQVPEHPSVALVGGKAFHNWVQAFELSKFGGDPVEPWLEYLDAAIESEVFASGLQPQTWKVSGRKTKAHPDGETLDVWATELGPSMVELYQAHDWGPWRIAMIGGAPGIEYAVELPAHKWHGYVDQIRSNGRNHMAVDVKSGSRLYLPSTQLEEYGAALRLLGVPVWYGGWYMARKGEFTHAPLRWTSPVFTQYVEDRHILATSGLYLPNVGDHCGFCPVRDHCKFV